MSGGGSRGARPMRGAGGGGGGGAETRAPAFPLLNLAEQRRGEESGQAVTSESAGRIRWESRRSRVSETPVISGCRRSLRTAAEGNMQRSPLEKANIFSKLLFRWEPWLGGTGGRKAAGVRCGSVPRSTRLDKGGPSSALQLVLERVARRAVGVCLVAT